MAISACSEASRHWSWVSLGIKEKGLSIVVSLKSFRLNVQEQKVTKETPMQPIHSTDEDLGQKIHLAEFECIFFALGVRFKSYKQSS